MMRLVVGLAVFAGWFISPSFVRAVDREQREYVVHIDGKEAGSTTMDISVQEDGLTHVATRANVKFQKFIGGYSLQFDAAEWWRDGRLVGVKSTATENGKRTIITVAVEANQLRARINNQERALPAETWTSSFWKLPDAKFHNNDLPMFEVDTGRQYKGKLLYIATEQLTVMGQLAKCYHFRYTGGSSPTDLWFDAQHRLVRQEFVELGHRTIAQLIKVSR